MVITGITIILMLASTISIIAKRKIEETIPLSVCMIILLFYFFGLFGVLGTVVYAVLAAMVAACFVYAVIRYRNEEGVTDAAGLLLTPGLIGFAVLSVFLWYFSKDLVPTSWDEFSHWALTAKDMYYYDRLSSHVESATNFKTYPPALAIFEYFFLRLKSTFHEGTMYYAYNIFTLSMLMPVFQGINWKKIGYLPVAIVLLVLFPYVYFNPYGGLAWGIVYIDKAMAYAFCCALASYFLTDDRRSLFVAVRTGCILAVLGLSKSTGILPSAVVLIAVAMDMLCHDKAEKLREKLKQTLPLLGVMLGIFAVTYLSWRIHLKLLGTPKNWNTSVITPTSLLTLLREFRGSWQHSVMIYFKAELFESASKYRTGILTVSYLGQIIVWFAALMVGAWVSGKGKRKQRIAAAFLLWIVLSGGYLLYLGSILISYLFVFSQEEALGLASFTRYAAVYWLGGTLFSLSYLFVKIVETDSRRTRMFGVLCVSLYVLLVVPVEQVITDIRYPEMRSAAYAKNTEFFLSDRLCYQEASRYLSEDDRVFVVANENFKWFLAAQYELLPSQVNDGWGNYDFRGTAEEWCALLQEGAYNYVWIETADENFAENCGHLFAEEIFNDSLYRITDDSGSMKMICVYSRSE